MSPTIGFLLVVTCTAIFSGFPATKANDDEFKTYIVHLTSPDQDQVFIQPHELDEWYNSFLSKVAFGPNQKPKMVHVYHHAITGFAATMTADQAKVMENLNGVASVRHENVYQLQTTRSPHFLGLRQNSGIWKHSNYGEGVIIGLLDTGITPGHPSFDDKGMSSPPAWWKGKCEVSGCNNKLIGMRNFVNGTSPIDEDGHGTHTSSTAAGNFVEGANVFGQANGTASGIAPLAHVAMYKVCGEFDCSDAEILAGIDAAIEEGVDVISISIGGYIPMLFYDDSIAIGAFNAIKKGVFVSAGAGNKGSKNQTLSNDAPWILTVGASTIDRRTRTTVKLGNNKLYNGEWLYQPKDFDTDKLRPLVYPLKEGHTIVRCEKGTLDHIDVKGKVVLCDVSPYKSEQSQVVKDAGGDAVIIANTFAIGETTRVNSFIIPTSYVGYYEGVEIKKYINSTSSPLATILFRGTVTNLKSDPEVAAFSSRGPCYASPGILKPDIIGPGVNILAAWPKSVDNMTTTTKATFDIISGTSMSCPHLAGTTALIKRTHPDWSPAAIKSAIMTTASQVSRTGPIVNEHGHPANIFAIGSGHVAPTKASDPGLVFDIQPDDYIPYLCGLGYTPKQVGMIVNKRVNCLKTIPEAELNYPSFSVSLKRGDIKKYSRTATNVGPPDSFYNLNDTSLREGVNIDIDVVGGSQELGFSEVHQKLTFEVTFTRDIKDVKKGSYGQGHITFAYDKYSVRMPLSFKFE